MPLVLLVLLGGAAGGLARHALAPAPGGWALLAVNALGAFALGALTRLGSARWRALLGTGFCGAFTTMSAVALAQEPVVLIGHAIVGLAAAAAGAWVVR